MATADGLARQAGAIPIRDGQVCLVSSRSGKRWVIPKGNIDPGCTAGEIALQEAWEEAGLVGRLDPEPLGSYFYQKDGLLCHVIVFVLQVADEADRYPECNFRKRAWMPFTQALTRLEEPILRELVGSLTVCRAG
jgi:8-oxo-dGTP pyrophosphatase MutT (NUDIX family)